MRLRQASIKTTGGRTVGPKATSWRAPARCCGKPTAGNVHALIPELAGLTFEAQLALAVDSRTGRSFNAIATIFTDGGE